jgi:Serine kinase of the HPr protein, regulates carbohydrate metabolism
MNVGKANEMSTYSVKLTDVVEELNLEIIWRPDDFKTREITTPDINRPGLQLAGFYEYYDPCRLQIIGLIETTYASLMTDTRRYEAFETFMATRPAALVLAHGVEIMPECEEMAIKYGVPLLCTYDDTSEFSAAVIAFLKLHLAPRITMHGVLVEIYGEGVLLIGESGIGKSETALELIKRGHRLIADDAVEIKRPSRRTLVGTAPELIRYYMELRGIGVINARRIFGIGAVKPTERIDLVVTMELWEKGKAYDRLGIDTEFKDILGVEVPNITIPVRPGRNLAMVLELAAMNNRQKKLGYNNALELAEKHDLSIDMMDALATRAETSEDAWGRMDTSGDHWSDDWDDIDKD